MVVFFKFVTISFYIIRIIVGVRFRRRVTLNIIKIFFMSSFSLNISLLTLLLFLLLKLLSSVVAFPHI